MSGDALFKAIEDNNLSIVQQLIRIGGDVNVVEHHCALLTHAVAKESVDIVQFLIENGANLNYDLNPPLCAAAERGNVEIGRILLARGADKSIHNNGYHRWTPLHYSSRDAKCLPFARFLIENGADINAVDENGETALFRAVSASLLDTVQYLTSNPGCNVNVRDRNGQTPIWFVDDENVALMRILIDAGADIDFIDESSRNLMYAHRNRPAHVRFLLACNAAVNPPGTSIVYFQIDDCKLSQYLLLAAGVAPFQCFLKPKPHERAIAWSKTTISKERIDFIRERATTICIGLQTLELSALELMAIVDCACEPFSRCVPLHTKWKIVTTVKHFQVALGSDGDNNNDDNDNCDDW